MEITGKSLQPSRPLARCSHSGCDPIWVQDCSEHQACPAQVPHGGPLCRQSSGGREGAQTWGVAAPGTGPQSTRAQRRICPHFLTREQRRTGSTEQAGARTRVRPRTCWLHIRSLGPSQEAWCIHPAADRIAEKSPSNPGSPWRPAAPAPPDRPAGLLPQDLGLHGSKTLTLPPHSHPPLETGALPGIPPPSPPHQPPAKPVLLPPVSPPPIPLHSPPYLPTPGCCWLRAHYLDGPALSQTSPPGPTLPSTAPSNQWPVPTRHT